MMVTDLDSLHYGLGVPLGAQTGSDFYEQMGGAARSNPYEQNKENSFAYTFVRSRGRKECPMYLLVPQSHGCLSAMKRGSSPPFNLETQHHCFGV